MTHAHISLWMFFLGSATVVAIVFGVLAILFRSKALVCSAAFVISNAFWVWSTLNIKLDTKSDSILIESIVTYLYWAAPSITIIIAGQAVMWWLESPRKDRYIKAIVGINFFISVLSLMTMYYLDPYFRAQVVFFIQPIVQITLIWLVSLRSAHMGNLKSKLLIFAIPLGYFSAWYASDFILNPKQITDAHLIYSPLMNLLTILSLAIAVLKISVGSAGNTLRFNGYEKKWDHLTLLPISLEFVRQLEKRFSKPQRSDRHIIICSISIDEMSLRRTWNLNSLDINEIYIIIANRIQSFNKFSDVVGRYTSNVFVAVFSVNTVSDFLSTFSSRIKEPFIINSLIGAPQTLSIPVEVRCVDMAGKKFVIENILYDLRHSELV
jgi:GGDEF domain-containing protein